MTRKAILLLAVAAVALRAGEALAQSSDALNAELGSIAESYVAAMNSFASDKIEQFLTHVADQVDIQTPIGAHLTTKAQVKSYLEAVGDVLHAPAHPTYYQIQRPQVDLRLPEGSDQVISEGIIHEKSGPSKMEAAPYVSHWLVHLRNESGWKIVGGILTVKAPPEPFAQQAQKSVANFKTHVCDALAKRTGQTIEGCTGS